MDDPAELGDADLPDIGVDDPGTRGGMAMSTVVASVAPVIAFVVVRRSLGTGWAIGALTTVSILAAGFRKWRGVGIGWVLPITVIWYLIRGGAYLTTGSEAVWVGTGIAGLFLLAIGLAGSVVVGRPAVGHLAPMVFPFPRVVRDHELYRSTMGHLTMGGAVYYVLLGLRDIWLYRANDSLDSYVIIRFLINWPIGMAAFLIAFFYAQSRLNRIPGFAGMQALLEDAAERKRRPPS